MPASIDWILAANAIPEVQVGSTLINSLAVSAHPKVLPDFNPTGGLDPSVLIPNLQELTLKLEGAGRFGAGAGVYCVLAGLEISDAGGTTIHVSDGAALIDSYLERINPDLSGYWSIGGLANGYNVIWLNQSGSFVSSPNTLVVPAGGAACLGIVNVATLAITSIDYAPRLLLGYGGLPYRKTGDTGIPGDTPPAAARFRNLTKSGFVWYWDGTAYRPEFSSDLRGYYLGAPAGAAKVHLGTAARKTVLPAGLPLSRATLGTATTGAVDFSLQKGGVQFGTIHFAAGATVGTFAAAADTTFNPGDVFSVVAPNPADGTLADFSFALAGIG